MVKVKELKDILNNTTDYDEVEIGVRIAPHYPYYYPIIDCTYTKSFIQNPDEPSVLLHIGDYADEKV